MGPALSLAPEQFRVKGGVPGLPCGVAQVLESLPETERKVLQAALDAPVHEVQHARIEAVLWEQKQVVVKQIAIGRHRRRQCRCYA